MLIHDAVRPLVPAYVVENVIVAVENGAVAVTPVVDVVDTIRQVDGDTSSVVDRSTCVLFRPPRDLNGTSSLNVTSSYLSRRFGD
ncbi:2-C-methyl-D-erythritol 4-phosphate cytidylyltransferase [Cutibacterium acnes JCM 18920]|nr:2-C-methyl-D-erythritol 4-phosphate cytidylyltransferase [Cutibacterium acnes JCM 18920]